VLGEMDSGDSLSAHEFSGYLKEKFSCSFVEFPFSRVKVSGGSMAQKFSSRDSS
jgi:hypothetical protein